jgi:FMN reductase
VAIKAVAISGSPRSPSKSKALAEALLADFTDAGCDVTMVDLATLPAEALLAREQSAAVDEAIAAVGNADLVIAATPTYRALYTGLLKCFFDLMPQGHLASKICVGLQTGIAPHHSLAVEYGLRPLFASLGGLPLAVLYVTDEEFTDGVPIEAVLGQLHQIASDATRRALEMA